MGKTAFSKNAYRVGFDADISGTGWQLYTALLAERDRQNDGGRLTLPMLDIVAAWLEVGRNDAITALYEVYNIGLIAVMGHDDGRLRALSTVTFPYEPQPRRK